MPLTKDGYLYSGYEEDDSEIVEEIKIKASKKAKEIRKKFIKDFLFYIDLDLDESYINAKIECFLDERSKDNVG